MGTNGLQKKLHSKTNNNIFLLIPLCTITCVAIGYLLGSSTFVNTNTMIGGKTGIKSYIGTANRDNACNITKRIENSLDILRTASSAGRFVMSTPDNNQKEPNWTDTQDQQVIYRVPQKWAQNIGYSHTLSHSFHRIVHTSRHEKEIINLPKRDQYLIENLRGKTVMFMGDSTDANIWSMICRCKREHNGGIIEVTGTLNHDNETECSFGPLTGCEGPTLNTCKIKTLNMTLHQVEGEYTVHPYGKMPYNRGEKPNCEAFLDLASCLQKKWNASCNSADSFRCMHDPSCPNHRPPDFIFYNNNLWFWFRMGWYGSLDEKNWMDHSWQDIQESYMANATIVVQTLTEYFPDVKLVALQTSVGTKIKGRVTQDKVMHINAAIRELALNLNYNSDIPPVGLLELEHMGHLGWNRDHFLYDDIHPQAVFNDAVSNILLNALAEL